MQRWYKLTSVRIFYSFDYLTSFTADCLSGWIKSPSSGTCIKLYEKMKNWKNARKVCKENGGDLVKIIDTRMNEFIIGETFYFFMIII